MFNALIVASAGSGRDGATRIAETLAGRAGLPVETFTVAEGLDVAAAIVERVRSRDGALLVMTTGAATLVSDVRQSVTAQVLAGLCQPVLILGPCIVEPVRRVAPTLLVGIDHAHAPQPAARVVERWQRTFGGVPRLIDVVARSGWPPGITDTAVAERADAAIESFAAHGIDAEVVVLRTDDPVGALVQLGEDVDDAVFVLTCDRWPGRSHWYSTTRRLLQRSPRPVLVVPADLPAN